MSKKPTPSKKQAVSSTRARHGAWVRKQRIKLANGLALETCPETGELKQRHFASPSGRYNGRQVFEVKDKTSAAPIQEIKA